LFSTFIDVNKIIALHDVSEVTTLRRFINQLSIIIILLLRVEYVSGLF